MTARQRIRDAIIAALNADRDPALPEATKRRWSPAQSDHTPTISVYFLDEPAREFSRHSSILVRTLSLAVLCVNSAPYPEASDDMVEPMLEHVNARLADAAIDGVDELTEVRTQWERAELDRFYLAATNVWTVTYRTQRNDIATATA